jgi:hypothetical protein
VSEIDSSSPRHVSALLFGLGQLFWLDFTSLQTPQRRGDRLFRGVLPSVACLSVIVRLHNEDPWLTGACYAMEKKIELQFPNYRRQKGDFKQAAH